MLKKSGKIHQKYSIRQLELFSDVKVSPYARKIESSHLPKVYRALWDTGSDLTVITKRIVADLKLEPFDEIEVITANGIIKSKAYIVNIILPGNISKVVRATECSMDDGVDILIGMDIITSGDFAISSDIDGNMYFAYRTPSEGEIEM